MSISQIRKDIHQFIIENRIQSAFNYLEDNLIPHTDVHRELTVIQFTFSLTCKHYGISTIGTQPQRVGFVL
jgi:hypothetical protein